MATPCLEIKTIGMMPTTEELQCKTESALTKMDLPVGCTPYLPGDWRVLNWRVSCDRPLVPGHTSTPSKPPGPFYVDTPPSSQ